MNCIMTYKDEEIHATIDRELNKIFGSYKIDIINMLNEMAEKFPEASIEKVEKTKIGIYVFLGNRTEMLLSALEEEENAVPKEEVDDE